VVQQGMADRNANLDAARRICFRVGINVGDVIVEDGDIFGDGVNVAARLEALAEPGEICVSATVREHVAEKLPIGFADMGEHTVKNIARPVRVWRLCIDGAPAVAKPAAAPAKAAAPSDRPSIAVLPFQNMSGDAEQEYFSDGITEDIITDLSKVSSLAVVSRNTAFSFKSRSVDIAQIGRQLKVAYVLEGSVRKAAGRVRITAQLIEVSKDNHVWAERYDRDLEDIFALQDEISQAIVKALKLKLLPEEKKAIEQRGTNNLEAYNLYLMARQFSVTGNYGNVRRCEAIIRLCRSATEIDPGHFGEQGPALGNCS